MSEHDPNHPDYPWDTPEAREVLRNYLRVVLDIHERIEGEKLEAEIEAQRLATVETLFHQDG